MGGYGHRNMYYMTGLPGWMRFGYSPGWIGRSATGLGPAAQFLTTGQWPTPQMQTYWDSRQATTGQPSFYGQFNPLLAGQAAPEQELALLKNQAQALESQLNQVRDRIAELEKSD